MVAKKRRGQDGTSRGPTLKPKINKLGIGHVSSNLEVGRPTAEAMSMEMTSTKRKEQRTECGD